MGGDTGDTPTPVIGDEACVYRPPQPRYRSIARTDMVIELPPLPPSSVGERRSDVSVLCGSQSSAVDLWIREGAIQRGLRFARS
ncbi:MAG: hypothetical protein IT223_07755 [Crocinitomicaceae bacterium]|nr:hypothetical protein [Crocinitomicaceae bacterium]